jgi:hypothetical protein
MVRWWQVNLRYPSAAGDEFADQVQGGIGRLVIADGSDPVVPAVAPHRCLLLWSHVRADGWPGRGALPGRMGESAADGSTRTGGAAMIMFGRRWCLGAAVGAVLAVVLAGCAGGGGNSPRGDSGSPSTSSPRPSPTAAAMLPHDPSVSLELPEGEWAVLTDPDSGARMLMPRPLEPRSASTDGAVGVTYAGDGVNLQVVRIPAGRHPDLDRSVEMTAGSLGGRMISVVSVTLDGYEGREIFVEGPDGVGFVYVRIVATATHLVSALVGGRDVATADERRQRALPTLRVS